MIMSHCLSAMVKHLLTSTIAFMLDKLELRDGIENLRGWLWLWLCSCFDCEISKDSEIIGVERIKPLADQSR